LISSVQSAGARPEAPEGDARVLKQVAVDGLRRNQRPRD